VRSPSHLPGPAAGRASGESLSVPSREAAGARSGPPCTWNSGESPRVSITRRRRRRAEERWTGKERGGWATRVSASCSCMRRARVGVGRVAQPACLLWMDGRMGLVVRKLRYLSWESTQTAQLPLAHLAQVQTVQCGLMGLVELQAYYMLLLAASTAGLTRNSNEGRRKD